MCPALAGYFRQDVEEMQGRSVLDEAIAGSGRVGDLHHELEALQREMSEPRQVGQPEVIRFIDHAARSKSRIWIETLPRFSTTQFVTSNLDLKIQKADHHQGGGDARRNRESGSNSIVIKILTSNPLPLKILRGISC